MFKVRRSKFWAIFLILTIFAVVFNSVGVFASSVVRKPILDQIEPKGITTVYTGQTLKLRALADSSATVTATVNKSNVTLKRTSKKIGSLYWFEGTYTVPTVTEGQDLGYIEFKGKLNNFTETRRTAGLRGIECPENIEVGEEDLVAGAGQQVKVINRYIDVFKTEDKGEDYAAPYYYNLPEGTIDYVKSVSGDCYELQSGRKVLKKDVKVVSTTGSKGDNIISSAKMSTDGEMTTLEIEGVWNVPFNVETSPIGYSNGNWVSEYEPDKVIITFDYTTKMDISRIRVPSNSAFKDAEWYTTTSNGVKQGVIELTLAEKGKYYGCYAEYESDGNLVLRFYNPITKLADARIVIDPGHGYNAGNKDSGAIGIDGSYESDLNLAKAEALKAELELRGATVYMLDSQNTDLKDLYERCRLAYEWEPHIYIAVHHNSAAATARGVETFYNTPFSMPLAKKVNTSIYQAYLQMQYSSGAKNRGYKFSEFAVTRQKQFASVLVEYGFITNYQEMEILKDANNVLLFARNTAEGIASYFSGI